MEHLLNIMRREAERTTARFSSWAIGTVSSFDGKSNVKVQLQPEDTQTGWLPVNSLFVGSGFGISIGPKVGTSCLVHFQDGDREAGVVVGFFYTDSEQPVSVKEGEIVVKTEAGSSISFLQDGSVTVTDKGGASFNLDGSGNITFTGKAGQTIVMDAAGNIVLTPSGSGKVALGGLGGLAAARNADSTAGNTIHATSTKVTVI